MTRNTVTAWETRGVIPKGATLDRLALRLGVSTDWILRGDRRAGPSSRSDPMADPEWRAFVESYEYIDQLTEEELRDIYDFCARAVKSRTRRDFDRVAEAVRLARPSPTFQAKKKAGRGAD